MSSQNLLFIINPISGGGKKQKKLPLLIEKQLDSSTFKATLYHTKKAGDGKKRSLLALAEKKWDAVIVVGGDGSLHEVASIFKDTHIPVGIIPCGSGNGLAYSLGIPSDMALALEKITRFQVRTIDYLEINGLPCFNIGGIGFEAIISKAFNEGSTKRGLGQYINAIWKLWKKYQGFDYQILTKTGKTSNRRAYSLAFANSNQYGNRFYINPQSSLSDGFFECCHIPKLKIYQYLKLAQHCFRKKNSPYVQISQHQELRIHCLQPQDAHIDGDIRILGEKDFHLKIQPGGLNVLSV